MQNSIFTIELPLVSTDEELEKVKAMYPNCDSYFITSGCVKERKKKFDKLWQKFKPYADKHFLSQIKTNFHQRTWEMYLGNVLLEKKLLIKSQNEGPDFVVNDNIYIECIAPTKGDSSKADSVPEIHIANIKKRERPMVQDVPVDEMILRITQALKDKGLGQYAKWKSNNWFDKKAPFIIAINTGDLKFPQDYLGIPLVIKALFGLQFLQITRNGHKSFSWREEIKKGKGVPVNYFTNYNFKFISGVIFSDQIVLNHPDNIGDDCIFVNNPFAKNPITDSLAKLFKNWNTSRDSSGVNFTKNYN